MTMGSNWHTTTTARLHDLAAEYGTPYFLFDADVVRERIAHVRRAMDGLTSVLYAVKSNPNLALLKAVRDVADGLDISSGGELEQARLAGFDPGELSFAGPAKTRAELEAAIRAGVGCISVESIRELRDCVSIAQTAARSANIALRINPLLLNKSFGLKMGGRAVQFGIDEENLEGALNFVEVHSTELSFTGIHVYAGSQCFDPNGIVEGIESTLGIARKVESVSGLRCTKINLGGGFGVSHGGEDKELDVERTGRALVPILGAFLAESRDRTKLVFELGRYLTASAGIYVTRVVSAKDSRGKSFVCCDGGLNHHLAAAGNFGATMRSNFAIRNLTRPDATPVVCSVSGPSCNPTDLLGIDVTIAKPEEGDLIGILKSGSYGLTASPMLFLGRDTPVELVKVDGGFVVGRRPRKAVEFN
jgi:diaminopimelate decarboxylase